MALTRERAKKKGEWNKINEKRMGKEKKILNIEWICDNNTKELYNMAYGDCYCATGLFLSVSYSFLSCRLDWKGSKQALLYFPFSLPSPTVHYLDQQKRRIVQEADVDFINRTIYNTSIWITPPHCYCCILFHTITDFAINRISRLFFNLLHFYLMTFEYCIYIQ
jgi:hypothetical protein